jgi:aerobic carbon-monoxide dehydrogenase large subunit
MAHGVGGRVEDARFLMGVGRYVDDYAPRGLCHSVMLVSPHAHALIRHIDTSEAEGSAGVICVLTGADVVREKLGGIPPALMPEDFGLPAGYRTIRPLLAVDRVRFVGDSVAMVVAETRAQALDAVELITVDYEPLPAVVTVEDAVRDGAPDVWTERPGNVSFTLSVGDQRVAASGLARARHVVALRLENNRVSPSPIEPRGCVAEYDPADQRFTLRTCSQTAHGARDFLARHILRVAVAKIRVISPDVGGSFGLKGLPFPEECLALMAARRCGRPVKWIASRSESFTTDTHGRDQVVECRMGLDANGKILAIEAHALQNYGAYAFGGAFTALRYSLRYATSVYDVDAVFMTIKAVFTHTAPLATYRGPGRAEANYMVERLLDRAAREMRIEPAEIRRRNYIPPEKMPYKTLTGSVYDSGEFERLSRECLELSDWDGFPERQRRSADRGLLRGHSIASYIEHAGNLNERMEIRFDPDGEASVVAGTHSHGQGHETVFAQLVAQWLGVPHETVHFVQGDTDRVLFGGGSYAARSSLVGGNALRVAADTIIAKGKKMAAHLLEAAVDDIEFDNGRFVVAGTDRSLPMPEVAKAFYRRTGAPSEFGLGLEASAAWSGDTPNYPNGCHVCEVEVDPESGDVRIDRYAIVDDAGVVLNPMICEGQIHGGVAQGIGQALFEHVVYDRVTGQLVSGSFQDYALPRADNVPHFEARFSGVPCATNPLGVKGVGECGTTGAPPAVINAILDALAPLGVDHIDMPATPHRVWQAIRAARRMHGSPTPIHELTEAS